MAREKDDIPYPVHLMGFTMLVSPSQTKRHKGKVKALLKEADCPYLDINLFYSCKHLKKREGGGFECGIYSQRPGFCRNYRCNLIDPAADEDSHELCRVLAITFNDMQDKNMWLELDCISQEPTASQQAIRKRIGFLQMLKLKALIKSFDTECSLSKKIRKAMYLEGD